MSTFNPGDIVLCTMDHNIGGSYHHFRKGHLYIVKGFNSKAHYVDVVQDAEGNPNGWAQQFFINIGKEITDLERIIWNLPNTVKD